MTQRYREVSKPRGLFHPSLVDKAATCLRIEVPGRSKGGLFACKFYFPHYAHGSRCYVCRIGISRCYGLMLMDEKELISKIKEHLHDSLDEWLGNDYPDEGTEDFDLWKRRERAIDSIETVSDLQPYAAEFERHEEEFLECWGL